MRKFYVLTEAETVRFVAEEKMASDKTHFLG